MRANRGSTEAERVEAKMVAYAKHGVNPVELIQAATFSLHQKDLPMPGSCCWIQTRF